MDGAFVRNRMRQLARQHPAPDDIYKLACSMLEEGEELFRIYFYDCQPYSGQTTHPVTGKSLDLCSTTTYRERQLFFDAVAKKNHIAFRRGELTFRGWRLKRWVTQDLIASGRGIQEDDLELDLQQKGVDMKIGLDVAWLSTKGIVDRIILCTGDSDFVPAMKFARREGVQVVLVHLGARIKDALVEHADEVRHVPYPPADVTPSSP
ncbi:MAG: hypothetical protein Kow00122_10870 [Thermoleophilia bacterium]